MMIGVLEENKGKIKPSSKFKLRKDKKNKGSKSSPERDFQELMSISDMKEEMNRPLQTSVHPQ